MRCGVAAVSVRDDGQVERGRERAYLDGFADAAAPVYIGLENVHRAVLDYLPKPPSRVLVFAAGYVYRRGALNVDVALQLVRHDRLFEPAYPEVRQLFRHAYGVWDVPRAPGVEHDVDVVAHRLAQRPRELDVAPYSALPVGRSVSEEPLCGGESVRGEPGGAAGGVFRLDGEAERAGVSGKACSRRSSEQLVHRLAERLAFEVPQPAVDDAYRHHRLALAPVNHRAVHDVPQQLYRPGVAPDEQRRERGRDDERLHPPAGTGQADQALVRVDFEKDGAHRIPPAAQTR